MVTMKVNTLHYLYTKKGEKLENNVGMTIFLPKSLQLSEKHRIFAPASNGS